MVPEIHHRRRSVDRLAVRLGLRGWDSFLKSLRNSKTANLSWIVDGSLGDRQWTLG
ncbi:hypothetical protein AB0758_44155 [Tolypothrix bouteillei VB521301_2]|uniref:hypothetical protein n=1 Tax=Tolypothrix bouteillei TaxID=1246981 RepID=UPI0038B45574